MAISFVIVSGHWTQSDFNSLVAGAWADSNGFVLSGNTWV